ncbi:NADH-quinone oxidoreductase subunit M [Synechocystis sp. LKSZ1]|uniref:NADH-quinone oxidoreductase subunit M n=1 Tax=Synechocystis sp. LKSZ1 TaxID=3144951 RepID=UPI00336C2FF0
MLSALLILPTCGALLLSFWPGTLEPKRLRQITEIVAVATLAWSLWLLFNFDLSNPQFQFEEYLPWLPPLGLSYSLGLDGLSLPLVILNGLLTGIAIYSIGFDLDRPRLYYALILLINAGISGALMAENLLLFIIFYELELIPFYLMIAIWGGEKRGYASIKFLLYTAISGLLVLIAFLGIGFLGNQGTFDYSQLSTENFSDSAKLILLTLVLVGFGIKIPLVPLHTWLPDAYTEASPATAILLGGILAKLGTYGLIRFGLQLFPQTWVQLAPILAIVGTITVLYGALAAIAQKDIKRMVAYSSIGHMGYILVAAAAGTELSVLGAVAQMISHGLILALLFHLVGIVERKVGTRDLDTLNGLMNPIRGLPLTSALLITAGMASAGIPGLVGFAAEFIVFQGSFATFPIPTLLCIIASGLTAVYFVILLNRTCFGRLDNQRAYYPKVLTSEMVPALVLTAIIFFLGIQPNFLVKWIEPTTDSFIAQFPSSPTLAQQEAPKIGSQAS